MTHQWLHHQNIKPLFFVASNKTKARNLAGHISNLPADNCLCLHLKLGLHDRTTHVVLLRQGMHQHHHLPALRLLFAEICWTHHAIHRKLMLSNKHIIIRFVSWEIADMILLGNTCAPCFLVFFELGHRTSRTFSTFGTVMQLTSGKTTSPPAANDGGGITVNLPVFTLP